MAEARRAYGRLMQRITDDFDALGVPVTTDLADAVHEAVVAPFYDLAQQASLRATASLGLVAPPPRDLPGPQRAALAALLMDLARTEPADLAGLRASDLTGLLDTVRPEAGHA